MTKQVQCKMGESNKQSLRIRVIKAPLVDSRILRNIISERAKAIVL